MYNAALNGEQAPQVDGLPAHLRFAAQSAGEGDALAAEQAKYFGEQAGLRRDDNWKKANLSTRTTRTLDAVAKAVGVQVRFAPQVAQGRANAQYENGVISIALDAQDPVRTAFTHEIVHRIRQTSPESYEAMARFIQANMSGDAFSFAMAERAGAYQTQDASVMTEELVADAFGRMLGDSKALEQFVRDDRTVGQRVLDAVHDLVAAVKRALTGRNVRLTQEQRAAFRELEQHLGGMERVLSDALNACARQAGYLTGQEPSARGTMETGKFSLKEDLEHGGAREETRGAFLRRAAGAGYEVYEGETVSYGYRRVRSAGENARQVQEELNKLSVPSFLKEGPILRNDGTTTITLKSPQATTLSIGRIAIDGNISLPSKNVAGHEAFHLWKNAAGREAYIETVEDNLLFSSEALREYQSSIAQAYLGGEADLTNDAQMEKLREELFAYISGDIHEGINDEYLRPMFRDYDAVKAAWEALVAQKNTAQEGGEVRFSIKYDQSNTPYVVIEKDILAGVPQDKWVKAVKDNLREHFPDGVSVGNNIVAINKQSRMEMTFSKYMQRLFNTEPQMYADKLRTTANADEILRASRNWVNEALLHPRKDDIIDFARGEVQLRVGENDYIAQVIVGNRGDNGLLLYDIINLSKTTIQERIKKTGAEFTANAQDKPRSRGPAPVKNSVPQDGGEIKAKFSMKSPVDVGDVAEHSLKTSPELSREIEALIADGKRRGRAAREIAGDIQRMALEAYQSQVEAYGAIKAGEKPVRQVSVPRRTDVDKRVSQTVRTVLEAGATPEEAVPTIEELTARGEFSYEAFTDERAKAQAETAIRDKGYATALADWSDAVGKGEVSKRNTALGWALYNAAANRGDMKTAMTVLTRMVGHQRNAAQAVQATRIIKQMSPEGQLYGVQRSVENLREELEGRYGDKAPDLEIDQRLARALLEAGDQKARDEALKDLYRDIGRQMPARFVDKWNAWRYLAMLGNPRTHVRNIVGNAFFAPVVAAKDLTATAIESLVYRVSGGRLERTKGAVGTGQGDRALLAAAWGDYANVQEQALGGGKYSDYANANKYIEEGRTIFRSRVLEGARKANSAALDAEDVWFSRPHYAYALAQYCKANHITARQAETGKGLDKARAYAVQEAQKATYRDTNAFSQAVSDLGRYRGRNAAKKGLSLALEGILPFRKTPANILARGVEYSPLGLLKGLSYDLAQVRQGKLSGAEAIDHISAGLTGTGLMALGVYLAAQGIVRGAGGDDKDKKQFEQLMGHQAYALELPDGTSVTLDWLAPEALPFFVGVNLWEQTQGEGEPVTMEELLTAMKNVTEPLLEMSCLQSLNDVFDAVGYASSNELGPLPSIIASSATSYLTQAFPTLLGQAERTGQEARMTTYTQRDAFLTADMQYTLGRVSGRVPGWDFQQIPYIDAWGRRETQENVAARAAGNFLNPAYTSTVETGPMEEELLRLYEATGEGGVLPERARKYFTVDGERKDLDAEGYVEYATAKGQAAYQILTQLVAGAPYQAMSDTEKAQAAKKVYEYADAMAKMKVSQYQPEGWVAKAIRTAETVGVEPARYVPLYLAKGSIESLKDQAGETIPNSLGLQIMEMVYGVPGLTDEQRQALFADFGVGKSVMHYNKALVREKLAEARRVGA